MILRKCFADGCYERDGVVFFYPDCLWKYMNAFHRQVSESNCCSPENIVSRIAPSSKVAGLKQEAANSDQQYSVAEWKI